MSHSNPTEPAEPGSGNPDAVRANIDRTRAELADTVRPALRQAQRQGTGFGEGEHRKDRVSQTAALAKASAAPAVQQALRRIDQKAAPIARQVSGMAAPHRGKIIAGALAAIAVLAVVRRRRAGGE